MIPGLPPRAPPRSPEKRAPQSPPRPIGLSIRRAPNSPGNSEGEDVHSPNPMAGLDPIRFRIERITRTPRSEIFAIIDITTGRPTGVRKYVHFMNRSGYTSIQNEIRLYTFIMSSIPEYTRYFLPVIGTSGNKSKDSFVDFEWLEGTDLSNFISGMVAKGVKPHDRLIACNLLSDVADALIFCHRHGIVHGDIKPENIYVSVSSEGVPPRALLFDLGEAYRAQGYTDTDAYIDMCILICSLLGIAMPQLDPAGSPEYKLGTYRDYFHTIATVGHKTTGGRRKRKSRRTRRRIRVSATRHYK